MNINKKENTNEKITKKDKHLNDDESSNLLVNIFPVIIIFIVLSIFLVLYILFFDYKENLIIDSDGFFIKTNENILLGNKRKKNSLSKIEITPVIENNYVYKNKLENYFYMERENIININYPLFANEGLTLINYNDNINLIDKSFDRTNGYPKMILSYGNIYDLFEHSKIDENDYILLSYEDNVMINLYDLTIKTTANEYNIPINSFIYFEKDKISYYERKKDSFVYKEIGDISFNSLLSFKYEATLKEMNYTYEELLDGIDTVYIANTIPIDEKITPDKPKEEVIPKKKKDHSSSDGNLNNDSKEGEFVWEKPSVKLSNLSPNVFTIDANLEIIDNAGVIVKAPTFTIYRNNKTYIKRTYYTGGKINLSGLVADTTFKIVGQYTYLKENLEDKAIVTFYSDSFKTKSFDELTPMDLSFENGKIYSNKIEVNNIEILNDMNLETVKGISRASLNIRDKDYYFTNTQISNILNKIMTNVTTSESLPSSQIIEYEVNFYDKEGNKLPTNNSKGKTRTSKTIPNITLKVNKSEVDEVEIGCNIRNDDLAIMDELKYIVKSTDGKVISDGIINGNKINLTNLDPDRLYTISIYTNLDIDDGEGIKKDYELSSMSFTSKPLTSLGFLNLNMKTDEITSSSTKIIYSINANKTDKKLIKLLSELRINILDENNSNIVTTTVIEKEDLEKLKNGEEISIIYDELSSDTKYMINVKTILKQGSITYEMNTNQQIDNFITNKKEANVFITNCFTTENMIDFDVRIVDDDGAILLDYVRLELRDKNNVIKDSKKIPINTSEPTRITYNNLNINEFYNIYFYADEYNETRKNSTFKNKYLFKQLSIYTDSGISGRIELDSSLRVATSNNLADVKSEVKWVEILDYYTVPKTVDENGHLHIYSKNGSGNYAYDLSDYHGEFVTVSFSIKTITNTNNYSVYFTNYMSGTTSTAYTKKLEGINDEEFKSFSFTYRLGNYSYLSSFSSSDNKYYPPVTSKLHGKNYGDFAGFYISGGNAALSEFEIKDFNVYLAYNKQEYTDESYKTTTIEQGRYNGTTKQDSEMYVRLSNVIYLKKGYKYSFEFDNDTNYTMYMYTYDESNKNNTNYGWYTSGFTLEPNMDKYARIWFRYREGNGLIFPEDIKNFKIYEYAPNNNTGRNEFKYNLVTKVNVSLADKRDEITNNDYYIKIYNEGIEENEYVYYDLENSNTIRNIIKSIELNEKKEYTIELGIKIRERYYALDSFEISTYEEVYGIKDTDDWSFIEPYGHYIVLNDLNFEDYTDQRLGWGNRLFHGVVDFQGYHAYLPTQKTDGTATTTYVKMYRIEQDAVIKNAVFDIDVNNQAITTSIYGFVEYNYGTMENIILNIKDSHSTEIPQIFYGLLTYYNGVHGIIRNFVINLDGEFHMYNSSGLLTRENYGLIENGYIYGSNVIIDPSMDSSSVGDNRQAGVLFRYGGAKSIVNRVYSTISFEYPSSTVYSGIFGGYYTAGEIRNSYIVGDTNPLVSNRGPFCIDSTGTTEYKNAYYFSKNIYVQNNVEQIKSSLVSLHDSDFQKSILGNSFNIDDMLELGYYPQVNFTSNKMPKQDYIELPEVNIDDYADIIYIDIEEKTNDSARLNFSVSNPLGEEVTDIVISDLDVNIISQTYKDGKSNVIVDVSNPVTFVSKYQIRSISTTSAGGYISTRKYVSGEKYLMIDFYKEIRTINDFININKSLNQNYILMNDLDFEGYSDFYINNFTGKLNGNNYTIKNISMTKNDKNGLFNQMNGVLKNITFDNVVISRKSTYYAIVGSSNSAAKFNNVHVNNINITIPDGYIKDNMYIGALVGSLSGSDVEYCSATNVKIYSDSQSAGIAVGGLIGYASQLKMSSSFVQNVDITVTKAITTNGVGGMVGRENSSDLGIISNCYSSGKIFSNLESTGGIAGFSNSYITNSYSSVNPTSDMSYIGGILGNGKTATGNFEKNIFLGNLYSSSSNNYLNRINGIYESSNTNYAMRESLINGFSQEVTNGENLLSYNDYLNSETYERILDSNAFDYSKSSEGIMPKLFDETGEKLLPYQNDEYLFVNKLNVDSLQVSKSAEYAEIMLYLDNPNQYEITDIEVDYANVDITRNILDKGKSIIYFTLTPSLALDNYRLSKITYKDENNNEISLDKNIKIDAIFYKYLKNFDDWQNISKFQAENYILENDIDFNGKTNINTNVMFNRLETPSDITKYSLSNINLNYTKNENYHGLIQKISTSIKNIIFDNITITDTTTSSNSYSNVIIFTYGNVNNVEFKNININSKYENYVGSIGRNYANIVHDINVENVNVTGKQYVGSLIAVVNGNANDSFENISASNVHISGNSPSTGGIFGHFSNGISYQDYPIYNHISIKDSDIVSTSYYVGGISGYGDCNYCYADNIHVKGQYYVGGIVGHYNGSYQYYKTVENSTIEGTDYYIGGVYGRSYLTYSDTLKNSKVIGLNTSTYGVGGISGYVSNWSHTYKSKVQDSIISNEGDRTGGVIGYNYYSSNVGYLTSAVVQDSTIIGNTKVGGLVGTATAASTLQYCKVSNTTIKANDKYAGGAAGYFDNKLEYGTHYEGYLNQVDLENVDVESYSYAGGIFGGMSGDPWYANRVRRAYISGRVNAIDNNTYGFGSGDEHNSSLLNQPRIYIYENSIVNNILAKDMTSESELSNTDLLKNINYYPGYITNGIPTYNERDINGEYSDYIKLEKGKEYQINIEYKNSLNNYNIYLYNNEYKYINSITSSSVEEYIEMYKTISYSNELRFKVYKDCYIIINKTVKTQIDSITLKEVISNKNSLNKERLLNSGQLKDRNTWVYSMGSTNAINYTKLDYSTTYWDVTPTYINIPSLNINDLSGNNYVAKGKVLSINNNGVMFDGTSEENSSLRIDNYNLPTTGDITISARVNSPVARSYASIFSSDDGSNGFGLYLHSFQIYVLINGSYYSTGYYIPMNKDVDISVVYDTSTDGKTRKFIVYVDGKKVYTHSSPTKMNVKTDLPTYIGYDKKYAPTSTSYRYVGRIKDVKVYGRALDENEIVENLSSSSGITNNQDLSLYFDFTNEKIEYEAEYPKVLYSSSIPLSWYYDDNHNLDKVDIQRAVSLPNDDDFTLLSGITLSSSMQMRKSLSDIYTIYPSGINTINLEFNDITNDMSFIYEINGKKYETKVNRKVYSLSYDYISEAKITLKNTYQTKTIDIKPNEYAKLIKYSNKNHYYISNGILYKNNEQLINDAVHIYGDLVLLNNNKIYNINTNEIQNSYIEEGILNNIIALESNIFEGKIIKTYKYYTSINNEIINHQIFIHNNELYMFDNNNVLKNNIVFGKYNIEEYQIVLTNENIIKSLKGSIKYPDSFANANIEEITYDNKNNDNIIMVRYESGNIISFNYITGEMIYKTGENMSLSIFEYINSSFSTQSFSLTRNNINYQSSKELINEIQNDNSYNDITNEVIDINNVASNKLNSKYINVYNDITNSYDIYNVDDIIKIDNSNNESKELDEDTKKVELNINNNNQIIGKTITPISEKIKLNATLYSKTYGKSINNTIKNKKKIIYSIIISFVIILLSILSYIYNKKEKQNV